MMGAEDEMVFAAEKQSGNNTKLIMGIVLILIVGGALFLFLTSPKQTGFFGLNNPMAATTNPTNTTTNNSTTDSGNWLDQLNPFKPIDTTEDETFKNIPLQADWIVLEHELSVSDVTITLQGKSTLEDSVSQKEWNDSDVTLQHFEGSIKLTSVG